MEISNALEEFAKKAGLSLQEMRKELEEIKERYSVKVSGMPSVSDMEAFAQLKARYALKHLKESLRKEK